MGIKKKAMAKLIQTLFKGALRHPSTGSYFKKIFLVVSILGIFICIGAFLLIGFGLKHVGQILVEQPIPEMVALEKLVRDNTIVLSEDQKTKIIPLLQELEQSKQSQEETQKIKEELLAILDAKQLEVLSVQQKKLEEEVTSLVNFGQKALEESINQYTGITTEGYNLLKSLSAWWKLNFTGNNATENLKTIIENP